MMVYLLALHLCLLKLQYPSPSLTGRTNHHPGNIQWRLVVEEKKDEYMSSIRARKPIIAMEVVSTWRDQSPPGRFIRKNEETGLWDDIGDEDARIKCSQTLRERKGKKRKNPNDDVTASSSAAPSLLSSTSVPTSIPTNSTVMVTKEDSAQRSSLVKINPNDNDVDSNKRGTSKKPTKNISMNGSGNFVSVMLFQIMLSDLMS